MADGMHNLAGQLLDRALERGLGDLVAVREGDSHWSYGQLRDQVARTATALRSLRIGKGERVAILMSDSMDACVAILGVIYAGAVAVPLSELARPLDVRGFIQNSVAAAVIVHDDLADVVDEVRAELPSVREVLRVGGRGAGERDFHALVRAAAPMIEPATVEADDTALLLYSASAGPSARGGVPHSHATPLAAFESFGRGVLAMTERDRVFSVVRLSTAYGLGTGLVFPLLAGAETILLPGQPKSEVVFASIDALAPSVLFATPTLYGQLARDAEEIGRSRPLARLRVCVSGAEGMPAKLVPRIRSILGTEVTVGYGLTEAFQFVLAGDSRDAMSSAGACGRPVPGIEARIVDDQGQPVGADVIGTLELRGPTLFQGYWGGEPRVPGSWFRTRDRFIHDEGGTYYHCGRVDELFKVSGKWVSPHEIEQTLQSHEAVWDCAVIGHDDDDGLIKPFAFVVANVGSAAGPELAVDLVEFVKAELAPYKYPRWVEFVDELPRGPTGKVLRYKLLKRR